MAAMVLTVPRFRLSLVLVVLVLVTLLHLLKISSQTWPEYPLPLPQTHAAPAEKQTDKQPPPRLEPTCPPIPEVTSCAACPEPVACPPRPLLLDAASEPPISALNRTFYVPPNIRYDPQGPRPDQIVLVTAADNRGHHGDIPDIHERTAANRKEYCAHHGYRYHYFDISQIDIPNAHPVWKKIPAIVDAFNTFPDAQWAFMLDLDAIIMTPQQDLVSLLLSERGMQRSLLRGVEFHGSSHQATGVYSEPVLEWESIDIIMSQDHNGLNAGAVFVRRSMFSQLLLDMWTDPFFLRNEWGGPEQDSMHHFVVHHPTVRKHFGLMGQRVANAYIEGGDEMRWMEGDLVVHFAGCWAVNKCAERFYGWWDKKASL